MAEPTSRRDSRASAEEETLFQRLAALVCDGEEVTADEVRAGLAACIDQTLLDPKVGPEAVAAWARANASSGFATLCVQPCNAARVAWELSELQSVTRACSVLAFPQGQAAAEGLCFETALLMAAGVSEFDMVMNYGAFMEGNLDEVVRPIISVLQTLDADLDEDDGCDCGDEACACGHHHHDHDCDCDEGDACDCGDEGERPLLKVILETGVLTDEQVCEATDLVSSLGVDFVKTSTGFGPRGATEHDVQLMSATVEPGVQVKAAGGIATLAGAVRMLEAGATRIGTSRGDAILAEFDALAKRLGYLEAVCG